MSHAHPEIEALLDYTDQLNGLVSGHQQEVSQLLNVNEQLQDSVRSLLDEIGELYAACEAKDARIAELEAYIAGLKARVAKLEARPLSINADKYFENFKVEHQVIEMQAKRSVKKLKSKTKVVDDPNQLDLWKDNPAISL